MSAETHQLALAVCEAPKAFGSGSCRRPPTIVATLAHVGAGPTTSCVTGEFTLCADHLLSIRREVNVELAAHPGARCESCRHPMRGQQDVVLSAVPL